MSNPTKNKIEEAIREAIVDLSGVRKKVALRMVDDGLDDITMKRDDGHAIINQTSTTIANLSAALADLNLLV